MTENTRKLTRAEYESRIDKIQMQLILAPAERTPSLLRAFALWLDDEKYLTQESARCLLSAAKSAGMAEAKAIQIIRDAYGCSDEKSNAVTIDRDTFNVLVATYKTYQQIGQDIGETPILTPNELESLDQA